jgi:L-threonylcarbamoyladenylate synthase
VGLESTVLDLSGEVPVILRPGGVTGEDLSQVLGTVTMDPGLKDPREKPKAPGMKYTHYSPLAEVVLINGTKENVAVKIKELVKNYSQQGRKVGLLLTDETWQAVGYLETGAAYRKNIGSHTHLDDISRVLYAELRNLISPGWISFLRRHIRRKV